MKQLPAWITDQPMVSIDSLSVETPLFCSSSSFSRSLSFSVSQSFPAVRRRS